MTMPSSREFEALFTAALDAVFVADDARVVVAVNPAACRLLGRPSSEVVGSRIESFLVRPEHIDTAWAAFLAGGWRTGRLLPRASTRQYSTGPRGQPRAAAGRAAPRPLSSLVVLV